MQVSFSERISDTDAWGILYALYNKLIIKLYIVNNNFN